MNSAFRIDDSEGFFHPTAVVEDGAKVGKFTRIWYFSHVAPGAVIGENCSLGQNTYVERNAIVGNGCRLGNSVSIFSHVELEDFVFCAPYMVFTHISFPRAAVNRPETRHIEIEVPHEVARALAWLRASKARRLRKQLAAATALPELPLAGALAHG